MFGDVVYMDVHLCIKTATTLFDLKNIKMLTMTEAYHLPKEWEKSGKDIPAEFKALAEKVEKSLATLERDCEFLSDNDHLVGGQHYDVRLERSLAIHWANANLRLLEQRVRELLFSKEIQEC